MIVRAVPAAAADTPIALDSVIKGMDHPGAGNLAVRQRETRGCVMHTGSETRHLSRALRSLAASTLVALASCGGGGGSSGSTPPTGPTGMSPPPTSYHASSGVAQKGPLILGSTVTAQQLNAQLSPTGQQFTYQVNSNLGTFNPTSTFTSQYIGMIAMGYYFDEVTDATSDGTITLNGISDLSTETVLNVNLLTTLAYQRIQNLVTQSGMTFAAARTQAEHEVLAAFHIPQGDYGYFGDLDLSKGTDGDQILAAISSLFVYGNSSGNLAALIAAVQSDIGTNGAITNTTTAATLKASGMALDPASIAANLTQEYASLGITFTSADISNWIDQDGDSLVGKVKFQLQQATAASTFAFPTWVTDPYAGTPLSISAGQLSVNGVPASGSVTTTAGDVISVSPPSGFSSGVLVAYLSSASTPIARVTFYGSNSWTPLESMSNVRSFQTATLLPNGLLLVTGGLAGAPGLGGGGNAPLASAELYDPAANAWTPAASMSTARSGHTAILLPSGQVLVVGGGVSTAELYDPATNTWSPAGSTSGALESPIAVLMPNGTVLVAGGADSNTQNILAIAQIYDPSTNTWSTVAPMSTPRWQHTGVVLQDGTVLVAGGSSGTCCDDPTALLASAEVYNPTANTWTVVGSMATARASHTAAVLGNGQAVVAGGMTAFVVTPYQNGGGTLASAEIYDPVAQVWSPAGTMLTSRTYHTMTVLPNGMVLVAGGESFEAAGSSTTLSEAELYDPTTNSWSAAASMNQARYAHTATPIGTGSVIVTGGLYGNSYLSGVESYW
jgi:N-acetylneuraminic acid mutarotase